MRQAASSITWRVRLKNKWVIPVACSARTRASKTLLANDSCGNEVCGLLIDQTLRLAA